MVFFQGGECPWLTAVIMRPAEVQARSNHQGIETMGSHKKRHNPQKSAVFSIFSCSDDDAAITGLSRLLTIALVIGFVMIFVILWVIT